jgi:hypothetical protein
VLGSNRATQPFYPVAVDRLGLAKSEIAPAGSRTRVSRIENARDQLGQGNLTF